MVYLLTQNHKESYDDISSVVKSLSNKKKDENR